MADRDEGVAVGRVEPGAGEQEAPDEEAAGDGEASRRRVSVRPRWRLWRQGGRRGRGMAVSDGSDHAGAVLLGDGEHGEDGDDRLAEVDAGKCELGGVLAGPGCDVDSGGDRGADGDGQDDGPEEAASRCWPGCVAWSIRRAVLRSCVSPAQQEGWRCRGRPQRRRTGPRGRPTGRGGSSRWRWCRGSRPARSGGAPQGRRSRRPG